MGNLTQSWVEKLDSVLRALNQTYWAELCPPEAKRRVRDGERDAYAYLYILFVMVLFAATVGSLILGYTRSRKGLDKQSDPYHVYIKNRVSMI
ncbi:Potassium voltage-gated channel subfamily E member 3 [Varanus komodoensis]|uniref:Potassium voltage-gated channel subfamily E regulatory subunit 3 n=1 Tax=Varanus komodoensis TaxID=61221 RepID=A0A8D2LLY7_VARKO|nr:potassium voltage-gated channel subfamily E member 3 [Varanus komodoensis]KAF7236601.1 Potassium voltage-gated channel subfamily E member 3 [Varanus komodoensis]